MGGRGHCMHLLFHGKHPVSHSAVNVLSGDVLFVANCSTLVSIYYRIGLYICNSYSRMDDAPLPFNSILNYFIPTFSVLMLWHELAWKCCDFSNLNFTGGFPYYIVIYLKPNQDNFEFKMTSPNNLSLYRVPEYEAHVGTGPNCLQATAVVLALPLDLGQSQSQSCSKSPATVQSSPNAPSELHMAQPSPPPPPYPTPRTLSPEPSIPSPGAWATLSCPGYSHSVVVPTAPSLVQAGICCSSKTRPGLEMPALGQYSNPEQDCFLPHPTPPCWMQENNKLIFWFQVNTVILILQVLILLIWFSIV